MIPYEDLDRALARWKARAHGAAGDLTPQPVVVQTAVSLEIEDLPAPADRTGEIDLGDAAVESYEEDGN
jgi:hypothetical protein